MDDNYLYQHKQMLPGTKSHGVKKAELEELRRNAIDEEKKPAYIIEYDGRRWYLILEEDFSCLSQPY